MKYVKTFEAYVSYSDYEKKNSRWGSPSDIESDLRQVMNNILTYGGISDHLEDIEFNDQSSDRGIKWEIRIFGEKGSDTIHAYKKTTWQGDYEFYLNKKKSSKSDIQQYFLDAYVSDLDNYIASMKSYDVHYQKSDDSRAYKRGASHAEELKQMYAKLSSKDQKAAAEAYAKRHDVKVDYKTFKGTTL